MEKVQDISTIKSQLTYSLKTKSPFIKAINKYWVLYLMMLPATIFIIVNNYLPMFGIIISFKSINYQLGILKSPWIGFDNFKFLFASDSAWVMTRNTLGYNFVFITLNLIIGVAFAIMFNEMRRSSLAKLHQSIMFVPFFLSMVVVSYLVYGFLGHEHGYLNKTILPSLGMKPIQWYSEPLYWIFILPIVNVWKSIGYHTVIYMAAVIGINTEYYEAALIDGASKWQQIRKITIPLISPVIITMVLLQIGRIFYADFGLFFQVTRNAGAVFSTTQVIDTYVYRTFLTMGDIAMSSAAGLYQSVIGFILVLSVNFLVRRFSKENALF